MNVIKGQIVQIDNGMGKLDTALRMTDNFKQLEEYSSKLQKVVEALDNNLRRQNLHLRGLKEGLEDDNLKRYLENLTGCLNCDTEKEVKLTFAHRLVDQIELKQEVKIKIYYLAFLMALPRHWC